MCGVISSTIWRSGMSVVTVDEWFEAFPPRFSQEYVVSLEVVTKDGRILRWEDDGTPDGKLSIEKEENK